MDAIFKRTSVRSYSIKPVKKKVIKKLLKAAMQAPSAGNQQPWEFIVVTDSDLIAKLSECSPYAKPTAKAPASIVMLMRTQGMRFDAMLQQDMGACAQNILLEATELGLGSVWQGLYPDPQRVEYVSELFSIPEGIVPFAIISIGYPKKNKLPKQKSRYDKKRIGWNECAAKPFAEQDDEEAAEKEAAPEAALAEETPSSPLTGWRSASNAAEPSAVPEAAAAMAEEATSEAAIAEAPEAEPAAAKEAEAAVAEEDTPEAEAAQESESEVAIDEETPSSPLTGWRSASNAAEPSAVPEAAAAVAEETAPEAAIAEDAPRSPLTGWRSASNAAS